VLEPVSLPVSESAHLRSDEQIKSDAWIVPVMGQEAVLRDCAVSCPTHCLT